MRSIESLGEALAKVFAPPTEALPPAFAELLDRLQALDARNEPAPGALSDPDFRRAMEGVLPDLRRFARSLTRDPDQADDLVQETMMKAWGARDRFQEGTNFRSWTYVILRNLFYSQMRRAKFKGDWDETSHLNRLATPAHQEHPIHIADLSAALRKIAPAQREALMLVGAGGMSYEEAAAIMRVAVGTVKSRVSRAREALLAIMEGGTEPQPVFIDVGKAPEGKRSTTR